MVVSDNVEIIAADEVVMTSHLCG